MAILTIKPQNLTGKVQIPSSKSMGHRELICARLAGGSSKVENITPSKDIEATERVLDALMNEESKVTLDCGESGSTLRFLIPLASLTGKEVTFVGEGKLVSRPLDAYYEIFKKQGIKFSTGPNGNLPLTFRGSLKAGEYELPGDVSSQFISGLLFALPLLQKDSTLKITSSLESKSYVELTINVLEKYGIIINHSEDYMEYFIAGKQKYQPRKVSSVEGDFSQIAFWLVAGTLGEKITGLGMDIKSKQGDKAIIDIINAMGGKVTVNGDKTEITAVPKKTHGTVIDAVNCPDIIPVLTVLAALSEGKTEIINAGRLRIKESDRLKAMTSELNKLGAHVTELEEGLIIEGVNKLQGGSVNCWNDHRIAMSLAIASIKCENKLTLEGTECVAKSYPKFWEDFKNLGGQYE